MGRLLRAEHSIVSDMQRLSQKTHGKTICAVSCRSVHACAAENFRNNAVIKSLSAARCNSRTVLLTLPSLRGDFVIIDVIQNSRLCVAGTM